MSRPVVDRFVVTRQLRMRYLDWPATTGTGGRTALLLHPNRTRADVWRPFVDLASTDTRFVAPDLRGHGETDWPEAGYTLDDGVQDVHAVVEALDLAPVFVLGGAINGCVALLYATRYPREVRGVVANDAGYALDPALLEMVTRRIRENVRHRSVQAALEGDHAADDWSDGARALYTSVMFERDGDGVRWRYHPAGVAAMMSPPDPPLLEVIDVRAPSLIVRGEHSKTLSRDDQRRLADAIVGARTAEIPDADHILSLDAPAAYARLVDDVIASWGVQDRQP